MYNCLRRHITPLTTPTLHSASVFKLNAVNTLILTLERVDFVESYKFATLMHSAIAMRAAGGCWILRHQHVGIGFAALFMVPLYRLYGGLRRKHGRNSTLRREELQRRNTADASVDCHLKYIAEYERVPDKAARITFVQFIPLCVPHITSLYR